MFHQHSAYLDNNLYRAGCPGHIHQDWKIECWEEEHVNTHILVTNGRFGNFELPHGRQGGQVAFRARIVSVLVSAVCVGRLEVHPFLFISGVSADSVRCYSDREGINSYSCDEASLGVFLSHPSTCSAKGTELHASSLLALRCEISRSGIAFPLLRHLKSLLWPFWPYCMPWACRTVPAGHDLLGLP